MSFRAGPSTKEILREQFRSYRAGLASDTVTNKSAAIVRRVQELSEIQRAKTVHCYWPLVDRGEIDTRPLIRTLHERGVQVVLPVVASFDGESPILEHRRYAGRDALQANRWGLYEPDGTDAVSPDTLDVVVVPALGADRNGHRIGHGSGYYDAFLGALDVPTIALVYAACLVDAIPPEPHDVPVSAIVTEHERLRMTPSTTESPVHSRPDSHG